MKISIWGIFPPPYGGLSIHIQRESELLNREGLLDKVYYFHFNWKLYRGYNFSKYVVLLKTGLRYTILEYLKGIIVFLFKNKSSIVHFHNSLDGAWVIQFVSLILRKRVIITIHDQMRIPSLPVRFNLNYLFINSMFLNDRIQWIGVNQQIRNQLINRGVKEKNISVIPAYLKSTYRMSLPEALNCFCRAKSPVISVYAFATNFFNGVDLYGIDLALKLVALLQGEFDNIGLVVCIPGRKDKDVIDDYNRIVEENRLHTSVFFQFEEIMDCASLWAVSDLYLRPTNTDGDSLAIREALDVSCITIASNCVPRPNGCVLFRNRDLDDLYRKVIMVLKNKEEFLKKVPSTNDFYSELRSKLIGAKHE